MVGGGAMMAEQVLDAVGFLCRLERDKDAVFVALCEIARQWIYEEGGR